MIKDFVTTVTEIIAKNFNRFGFAEAVAPDLLKVWHVRLFHKLECHMESPVRFANLLLPS